MPQRYAVFYRRINDVAQKMDLAQPALARIFRQCYANTLETTTEVLDDGTTFVFTCDIPAMWLRDSSAQVRPYLPFGGDDPDIRRMVRGLIRRQALYVLRDPYANAFNKAPNGHGHQSDRTIMTPWVWERKFELDSLCYPVQLCKDYWAATGDSSLFDQTIHAMFSRIIDVMHIEQHHTQQSMYRFERGDDLLSTDTLHNAGFGTPVEYTGMVWSGFRPSDDACTYGYLIPANMFAVVVLGYINELARNIYHDSALAGAAADLRAEIDAGIQAHGIVEHPRFGRIYAYETDGAGHHLCMDDANVPSLLSIPYLGYHPRHNPIYQNTRAFVLSPENPYYFTGTYAQGIGSPHTPPGYIWHLGLIMQGLTATDASEQDRIISMLLTTTAQTNVMHESFDPDDPARFTRPWFAWANSLCGEFLLRWALHQ